MFTQRRKDSKGELTSLRPPLLSLRLCVRRKIDCVIREYYNARTCYRAHNISKVSVSLAIQLSTHRGVKRAKNAVSEA